jgi:16S rRNA (uracil1498-N3)-methyltransferase
MRIYLSPESIETKAGIVLPPDKARHVASVMRCKKGDKLTVIDGRGRSYLAIISSMQKKDVLIDIIRESESESESESPVNLILCQGILKGEKMDLVIQKATELGVKAVIPLISARSQVRETRKTQRWRRIAEESAEQCGRAVVPEIYEPQGIGDFLETSGRMKASGGLVFWEGGGLSPDEALEKTGFWTIAGMPAKSPLLLCIGPEGGFEKSEVEALESRGFIRATLGRRILRADTAAVTALAIVQFLAEKNKTTDKV